STRVSRACRLRPATSQQRFSPSRRRLKGALRKQRPLRSSSPWARQPKKEFSVSILNKDSAGDLIDTLAVSFEGLHFQLPLFDQLRTDEAAYTMRLPAGRRHNRFERP